METRGQPPAYLPPRLAAAVSALVDTSPIASCSASPAQRLPARGNATFVRGTLTPRYVTNAPVHPLPSHRALPLLGAQLRQPGPPGPQPQGRLAPPRAPRALTVVKHGACREGELRVVFCLAGVQSSRLPQWRAAKRKHLLTLKPYSVRNTKAAPSCCLVGSPHPCPQGCHREEQEGPRRGEALLQELQARGRSTWGAGNASWVPEGR